MSGLYLFTGDRRAGLQQFSDLVADHLANKQGKGIARADWSNLDNCENFEHHPATFSMIEEDTGVVIIENLPKYFDYSRLAYLLEIEVFRLHQANQELVVERPAFLFTSMYVPRGEVGFFEKHYQVSINYNQ